MRRQDQGLRGWQDQGDGLVGLQVGLVGPLGELSVWGRDSNSGDTGAYWKCFKVTVGTVAFALNALGFISRLD